MWMFSGDTILFLDASKCVRKHWKGKTLPRHWLGHNSVSASPKVGASVETEVGAPLSALRTLRSTDELVTGPVCCCWLPTHPGAGCYPSDLRPWWPLCQVVNGCGQACDWVFLGGMSLRWSMEHSHGMCVHSSPRAAALQESLLGGHFSALGALASSRFALQTKVRGTENRQMRGFQPRLGWNLSR